MATDFGRLTVWSAGDEESLRNFTVCGYVWPASSPKVTDLRFYVQHVRASDPADAREVGLRQARLACGLEPDDPGVGFGVFAGHLDELTMMVPFGQPA